MIQYEKPKGSSAKPVKIIFGLAMVLAIPVGMFGFGTLGSLMFIGGLFGFIVGRFME